MNSFKDKKYYSYTGNNISKECLGLKKAKKKFLKKYVLHSK